MVEKIARDRRLRRRALPILGALALLVCAFAVWRESGRTRTAAMSQQEASTYGVYLVTPPADVLPEDRGPRSLTAEELLPYCTLESTRTFDNGGTPLESASYSSQVLPDWLPDCQALEELLLSSGSLYVSYQTAGGLEVSLTYGPEGLASQLVYDGNTDTLYQFQGENRIKTLRFRNGT